MQRAWSLWSNSEEYELCHIQKIHESSHFLAYISLKFQSADDAMMTIFNQKKREVLKIIHIHTHTQNENNLPHWTMNETSKIRLLRRNGIGYNMSG